MSAPTITFEIDGEAVSANEAAWYEIAPCGCASGITVVSLSGVDLAPRLTEADAWQAFYEGQAEQMRRDKASGHRMELGRRRDVTTRLVDCPHDPKWGTVEIALDGHAWAGVRGSRRTHLVPGSDDQRYMHGASFNEAWDAGEVVAVCGKPGRLWSSAWPDKDEPHCLRCEKAASR